MKPINCYWKSVAGLLTRWHIEFYLGTAICCAPHKKRYARRIFSIWSIRSYGKKCFETARHNDSRRRAGSRCRLPHVACASQIPSLRFSACQRHDHMPHTHKCVMPHKVSVTWCAWSGTSPRYVSGGVSAFSVLHRCQLFRMGPGRAFSSIWFRA